MKRKFMILTALTFLVLSSGAFAESMTDKEIITQEVEALEKKCEGGGCDSEDFQNFREKVSTLDKLTETFKFGVAIGFEYYKDDYIYETETIGDNRIVRISDSQEYKPSVWLETHYVWDGMASKKLGLTHSAPGFYVGARLLGPDSDIFEAFSLGAMWSFKRTGIGNIPPEGQIAESINIGIGPVWHKTKTLASGITEGQQLPADFNDVKLDERDEVSWMIMISAGF